MPNSFFIAICELIAEDFPDFIESSSGPMQWIASFGIILSAVVFQVDLENRKEDKLAEARNIIESTTEKADAIALLVENNETIEGAQIVGISTVTLKGDSDVDINCTDAREASIVAEIPPGQRLNFVSDLRIRKSDFTRGRVGATSVFYSESTIFYESFIHFVGTKKVNLSYSDVREALITFRDTNYSSWEEAEGDSRDKDKSILSNNVIDGTKFYFGNPARSKIIIDRILSDNCVLDPQNTPSFLEDGMIFRELVDRTYIKSRLKLCKDQRFFRVPVRKPKLACVIENKKVREL